MNNLANLVAQQRATEDRRRENRENAWRGFGLNMLGGVAGIGMNIAQKAIADAMDEDQRRLDNSLKGWDTSEKVGETAAIDEAADKTVDFARRPAFVEATAAPELRRGARAPETGPDSRQDLLQGSRIRAPEREATDSAVGGMMSRRGPDVRATAPPATPAPPASRAQRGIDAARAMMEPVVGRDAAQIAIDRATRGQPVIGPQQATAASSVQAIAQALGPQLPPTPPMGFGRAQDGARPDIEPARRQFAEQAATNPRNRPRFKSSLDEAIYRNAQAYWRSKDADAAYTSARIQKLITPPPSDPTKMPSWRRAQLDHTRKSVDGSSPYNPKTALAAAAIIAQEGRDVEWMSARQALANGIVRPEDLSPGEIEVIQLDADVPIKVPLQNREAYKAALAEARRPRPGISINIGGGRAQPHSAPRGNWADIDPVRLLLAIPGASPNDPPTSSDRAIDEGVINDIIRQPGVYISGVKAEERNSVVELARRVRELTEAGQTGEANKIAKDLAGRINENNRKRREAIANLKDDMSPGNSPNARTRKEQAEAAKKAEEERIANDKRARAVAAFRASVKSAKDGATDAQVRQRAAEATRKQLSGKEIPGTGIPLSNDDIDFLLAAPVNGKPTLPSGRTITEAAHRKVRDAYTNAQNEVRRRSTPDLNKLYRDGMGAGIPQEEVLKILGDFGFQYNAPGPSQPAAPQGPGRRGPDSSSAARTPEDAFAAIQAMDLPASQKRRMYFGWLARNGYGGAA